MAEINLRLDVTGFYFSEKVKGDDATLKTVKDVMLAVINQTAGTDREFSFKSLYTVKGEYCSKIQINYKNRPPTSRQMIEENGVAGALTPFPKGLKTGIYAYDDENPTFTNPQLAWQYYIVGDDGTGPLRSGEVNGRRTVVPFSDSNRDPARGGVTFLDNDVIVWRLVGICNGPTVRSPETGGGVLETLMRSAGVTQSENEVPETPIKYRSILDNR